MKRTNKKGFTIVELVIVIAVIAILAAVLIPNLSRLVEKANESKRLQEVEGALKAMLMVQSDATLDDDTVFVYNADGKSYKYTYSNGQLGKEEEGTYTTDSSNAKVEIKDGSDSFEITGSDNSKTTYKIDKIEGLGNVTVYISEADALQIDGSAEESTTIAQAPDAAGGN